MKDWAEAANKKLKGQRIKCARYMTDKEVEQMGWDQRALVIVLQNGHILMVSQDDEGNGPGAVFTTFDDLPIMPVIGL